MNVEQNQVADDPRTKQTDWSYESTCRLLLSPSNSHLLLLLLIMKSDNYFTITENVEGQVNIGTMQNEQWRVQTSVKANPVQIRSQNPDDYDTI